MRGSTVIDFIIFPMIFVLSGDWFYFDRKVIHEVNFPPSCFCRGPSCHFVSLTRHLIFFPVWFLCAESVSGCSIILSMRRYRLWMISDLMIGPAWRLNNWLSPRLPIMQVRYISVFYYSWFNFFVDYALNISLRHTLDSDGFIPLGPW